MRRRKSRAWQSVLMILVALLVVFYVGYQAYRSIYTGVETELAVIHSVYESVETEGLVYRTETVIPATDVGEPYYSIDNGTRVAKDSVIASIYNDPNSGRIEQQMAEIDEQIAAFKAIEADAGSGRLMADSIDKQTSETLLDIITQTEMGALSEVSSLQFDVLSLLSKKALVTNKAVDFSAKITELEQEKRELKNSYTSPTSKIKAPVAGYFADSVDGYEAVLDVEDVFNLSPEELERQMTREPQTDVQACGKIVSGYEWFLACVVPETYYSVLYEGRNLFIRMSFVMDESIPVTVSHINRGDRTDDKMTVVFRCDQMSAELTTIRKESVEIQLVEHSGLKVPKDAIVFNEKKEPGVFVRSGNVVSFRRIEQQYGKPADYVICEIIEEDGYLKMYDDIIVGGRDLYDGKIIR